MYLEGESKYDHSYHVLSAQKDIPISQESASPFGLTILEVAHYEGLDNPMPIWEGSNQHRRTYKL
jgi:hypothetical protein